MAAALPFAASGLGALFSGIGASKPKTQTSTTESSQSGTQDALLDKKQKKVNAAIFEKILAAIGLGPQVSQSDKNTTRGQINDTYDSAGDNLEATAAARGFGNSGVTNRGFRNLSVDRAKSLQSNDATLRDQAQNRFMQMLQAGFQFLTPRSFSSTSQGTSQSTGSMSGTPWQSSLGGGLGDLSGALWARQMGAFGGSSGSGGGGGDGGSLGGFGGVPIRYCWIAVELYGETDWRTFMLRRWLTLKAKDSWRWALAVSVYARTGRSLARWIHWHQPSHRVAKQLFDALAVRAMAI